MDLGGFENSHPVFACVLYLVLWVAITTALLWPFSGKRIVDRLPICLTVVTCYSLASAIGILPMAAPRLFEHFLGHSLQAISTIKESNGTLLTEPWLERWDEGVDAALYWIMVAGFWWAIVNPFRRRAWITNGIAVVFSAVTWVIGHAFVI